MEENIKNLIESMIYYGLTVGNESLELVIRKFFYYRGEEYKLLKMIPDNHPVKKYYNKVDKENFNEIQLISFAKMCMWEIQEKVDNWEFLYNEEQVDKFVEEIYKMNNDDVEEFIKENKNILTQEPNKYNYYFALLYRYLTAKKEYENNVEFLKNQIDLIEKCEFGLLFSSMDELDEEYEYLLVPYDNLTWELCEEKQYDLGEEYYKKYINFLEKYLENHDLYQAKSYLAAAYSKYRDLLWDKIGHVNEKAEELTYKTIELKGKLAEEYSNKKAYYLERIAIDYSNLAYEYKKEYKKEKIEKYKNKCYELYQNSIYYRLELNKLNEFKSVDDKIKNYNRIAYLYYVIYEDEKAKENWNIALEICKNEGNSDEKWIEEINNYLKKLNGKEE